MTAGSGRFRDEGGSGQASWLWIALPACVLLLIAAVWFFVISPGTSKPPKATATPARTSTPWPTLTIAAVVLPTSTATPAATATPTKPTAIGVGVQVEVTGTGGSKLNIRQQASTGSVSLKLVPDGTRLTVVGGPEQANGFTWWKVDDGAGTVGYAAAQYLKLVQ